MFLGNLNFKQKKIFLGLAKKILVVDDGIIDNEEEIYLRTICNEMYLGIDDEEDIALNELSKIYSSNEEKRLILVELIALAYSNGEYHKNEKAFILDVIEYFELKKSILDEIENLVRIFFETQNKIVNFIALKED